MEQQTSPPETIKRNRKRFLNFGGIRTHLVLVLFLIAALGPNVAHAYQTSQTITGTVTDQTDQPLIGVTISVVDHITGTTTDLDGKYNLDVPETATHLKFSYVGFESQTVEIGDRTTIDLAMEVDPIGLDEIVEP